MQVPKNEGEGAKISSRHSNVSTENSEPLVFPEPALSLLSVGGIAHVGQSASENEEC
ncbi:hypothetical protein CA85_32000 [Allorhodopirellula solitaria]|uniref:Uncharacterized protein n=1 Tax=Allorhodopirellula solitaria TaxID=2527987 RepID=A0A5C5XRK8_9BACT|nr:hypothetical protein CA85_32000 [Allorhodopirellula solitaria]